MIIWIVVVTLIGGIVMFFDGFGSLPKEAKKKRLALFILIILVIITLIISLGVYIIVIDPPTTANTMINAFHNDRELFDAVVGELEKFEKFSGGVCVYRDKDDIHSSEDHVVKIGSLYFTSEEVIEETSLALLYDVVNPVFQKYDIEFLFGVEGQGQFVFEDDWGRRAFLGYSKDDKSQARMTVIEEVHICEGWYAIVYTD